MIGKYDDNGVLEFENMSQALTHYIDRILAKDMVESANPKNRDTYKKGIVEVHPVFFKLKDPKKVVFPHKDYRCLPYWVVSEILTEMNGLNPPLMEKYRKDIVEWSYDLMSSGRACYGYGTRWLNHNSLEKTFDRLKANPTSKRCYVPIFDQNDVGDTRDAPCNLGFSFLLRDNKLDLSLFTRSIDILKGFRYDPALFSFIQQSMASWLGVENGDFYYFCNSLHCYSQDTPKLKALKQYLSYHENDILELEVDKGMEIGKTYEDLRKLLEVETLSRAGDRAKAKELIERLNYRISRDFGKVYLLKNNTSNMIEQDETVNSLETKCKNWVV
jgi:thymidylate synthase